MALNIQANFKGLNFNAYVRVSSVLLNKESMKFNIEFCSVSDGAAIKTSEYVCNYILQGDNPIKQAYEHLKTLPEFAGAADV